MKRTIIAAIATLAWGVGAHAQSLPDLKGTWSGSFKTAILGSNPHHPGTQTATDPPRVRQIDFTFEIEGQDGRLVWGKSWSSPERKEPFVGTISADRKTILGADTDGSINADISNPSLMDLCYTQTGLGPSHAIVATCGELKRAP
jgi:hypothetical protein